MENAELFSSENNSGDHFAVEELLNLTETDEENDPFVENSDTGLESSHSSVSGEESSFTGEIIDLCVPNDDIAELEWLSNFVDHDSFSSEDLQNLNLISGTKPTSEVRSETQLQIESSIHAKSRTKRPHPVYFESHHIRCQSDQTMQWIAGPMGHETPSNDHPAPKKKRRVVVGAEGRRCLHCDTDKTPQWRTGPMGPKTLCNACGVRYKSGRLVPEYRPAASPTFVMDEHSNSHRKVMELRRKKEGHKFDLGDGMVVFDGSNSDSYLIHHPMGPDFRHLI